MLSDAEKTRFSDGGIDDETPLSGIKDTELSLSYVKAQVHDWHDETYESRERSCRDRDYYDGDQYTDEELAKFEKRGQPAITYNRCKPKIDYMLGTEIDNRKTARAYAKRPDTELDADAATDAIRYKCDAEDIDSIRSAVANQTFVEGAAAALIVPDARNLQDATDFSIEPVYFKEFYADPESKRRDYRDALFMGVVKWMQVADAKAMCNSPEAHYAIDNAKGHEEIQEDVANVRPSMWSRRNGSEVQIFQHWVQAPDPKTNLIEWYTCVFCAGGFLEPPEKCQWEYLDRKKKKRTWCPLIPASGYIKMGSSDHAERYGAVRSMIGPQDEINHRRSKAIHDLHSRKLIYEQDVFERPEEVRAELHKPDAMVEVQIGSLTEKRFEVLDNMTDMAGQVQMLQEAKAEIDQTGPRPMTMPEGSTRLSGRLFIAQQEVGAREMRPIFDNIRDFTLRLYKAIWRAIKQLWTYEMWLAIEEHPSVYRFVGLNQPTTRGRRMYDLIQHQVPLPKATRMAFGEMAPQLFQQAAARATQEAQMVMQSQQAQGIQMPPTNADQLQKRAADLMAQSPFGREVIKYNDVGEIDVDIKLEEAPNSILLQHEQFQEIVGLIKEQLIPMSPELLKLIIEMSALSNKDRLLSIINKPPDPKAIQQQQQMAEMEQQRVQKTLEVLTAQVAKLQADAAKTEAQAQLALAKQQVEPHSAHLKHAQATKLEAETASLPIQDRVHLAQAELDRARADAIPAEVRVKQQLARNASGDGDQ